jgi:hypothetical protein
MKRGLAEIEDELFICEWLQIAEGARRALDGMGMTHRHVLCI